jgi:hypothetical protein
MSSAVDSTNWSPILALKPVLSQANFFCQFQLSVVEGPKSIRLQFKRNGNVQAVERSNSKLGPVATPEISAYLERVFGHANLHPHTAGFVALQLTMQLIGLVWGQHSTKDVLCNSVCPLRAMKWREP